MSGASERLLICQPRSLSRSTLHCTVSTVVDAFALDRVNSNRHAYLRKRSVATRPFVRLVVCMVESTIEYIVGFSVRCIVDRMIRVQVISILRRRSVLLILFVVRLYRLGCSIASAM